MKNYNLLQPKGYPMYQKIKCIGKGIDTKKNQSFGDSTINIVHTESINTGDILLLGTQSHTVTEVLEVRDAKGKHIDNCVFQIVQCKFIDNLTA